MIGRLTLSALVLLLCESYACAGIMTSVPEGISAAPSVESSGEQRQGDEDPHLWMTEGDFSCATLVPASSSGVSAALTLGVLVPKDLEPRWHFSIPSEAPPFPPYLGKLARPA